MPDRQPKPLLGGYFLAIGGASLCSLERRARVGAGREYSFDEREEKEQRES
jgi:hypothetical protein